MASCAPPPIRIRGKVVHFIVSASGCSAEYLSRQKHNFPVPFHTRKQNKTYKHYLIIQEHKLVQHNKDVSKQRVCIKLLRLSGCEMSFTQRNKQIKSNHTSSNLLHL